MNEDAVEGLHGWERKALSALMALLVTVFGLWAGVVYNTGQDVLIEVAAIRRELAADRVATERRLTILEQRQSYVVETLRHLHNGVTVPSDEDEP